MTTGPQPVPRAVPVIAYLAASTVGGIVAALGLNVVGLTLANLAPPGSRIALAAAAGAIGVIALGCEAVGRIAPLPERQKQVPKRWLFWRSRATLAVAYGLMVGAGGLTFLRHAALYVVAVLVLIAPTLATGVAIGATYGATRGATVLVTWIADRRERARPDWLILDRHFLVVRAALCASAVIAAAVVLVPNG